MHTPHSGNRIHPYPNKADDTVERDIFIVWHNPERQRIPPYPNGTIGQQSGDIKTFGHTHRRGGDVVLGLAPDLLIK